MKPDFEAAYPDRAVAACTRQQAEALLRWDHHRVLVGGRWAVLWTLPWLERAPEERDEPLELVLVFHHATGHPAAPAEVQAMVDRLAWRFSRPDPGSTTSG